MGIYGHKFDALILESNYNSLVVCDENKITDALKNFVESIKRVIVNCIDKINKLLDKHPDSKIAQGLKGLLTKFKEFLTRADKVDNKEDASKLKSDVDKTKETMDEIDAEMKFDMTTAVLTTDTIKKEISKRLNPKEGYEPVCLVRYHPSTKEQTNIYDYVVCHFGFRKEGTDNFKTTESIKIGFRQLAVRLKTLFEENDNEVVIVN